MTNALVQDINTNQTNTFDVLMQSIATSSSVEKTDKKFLFPRCRIPGDAFLGVECQVG